MEEPATPLPFSDKEVDEELLKREGKRYLRFAAEDIRRSDKERESDPDGIMKPFDSSTGNIPKI